MKLVKEIREWTSHGTHVYSYQMPLSALRKTALREIKIKRDVI